jgi:hypothetical protein
MRKMRLSLVLMAGFLLSFSAIAGGGSVGLTPGTGVKVLFGNNDSNVYIPIRFEGEGYLGSEGQHGLGGAFGYDIGVGNSFFNVSVVSFNPEYKYHFNGGLESGPFVGAYTDFRFGNNANIIGIGALGGYQHYFGNFMIYGAGNVGFGTSGSKFVNKRNSGGEFGVHAGVRYAFGK